MRSKLTGVYLIFKYQLANKTKQSHAEVGTDVLTSTRLHKLIVYDTNNHCKMLYALKCIFLI